jgi:propionate CoA-transferase
MRPVDGGLEIVEIAPGVDLERDVIARMGFQPRVSPQLKRMDRRLFSPEPMNLLADLDAKQRAAEGLRVVG